MTDEVKGRVYRSVRRSAQAEATRRAVLTAARDLFVAEGYACPVARIAGRAGVALDTVYATVGRKPELVLAVIDMVLAGRDEPVAAEERDYVRDVRAAVGAREKLTRYARALVARLPAVAPLQQALRDAGATDPRCVAVWEHLVDRRAANMLLLAGELRATGDLRDDLDDRRVADVLWATNSAEYFLLLTRRGWSPETVGEHLVDLWTRSLLRPEAWDLGPAGAPGAVRPDLPRP